MTKTIEDICLLLVSNKEIFFVINLFTLYAQWKYDLNLICKKGKIETSKYNIAFPNKVFAIFIGDGDFGSVSSSSSDPSVFSVKYLSITNSSFKVTKRSIKTETLPEGSDSCFLVAIGI